jgi:hypothetical protein
MTTMSHAIEPVLTEDYMFPTQFCSTFRYSYSTTNARIRRGEIALHQFPGDPRPRIEVAEALRVMSAIKRPYTGPTLRVVRHDDAAPQKADLFG